MEKDNFGNAPVRELLRLSQTNVTPDPEAGYNFAVQAYNKAHDLQVMHDDPTALGEAAAKAGFRSEQADHPTAEVAQWFKLSYLVLPNDRRGNREKIATRLLEGRALSLRLIRQALVGVEMPDLSLSHKASDAFRDGEEMLIEQHTLGSHWDRYGTMLSRHRATHEAMFGNGSIATTTALRGIWRAIEANKENNTTKAHLKFVTKQIGYNSLAGILAFSQPLNDHLKNKRLKLANWLSG
jgi:hypothetical protein